MIEAKGITYKYDSVTALSDVSIHIERGLKYALLGANGAGKTTFLLHLNGILRPLSGKIFCDGTEVTYDRKALTTLRRHVGVVFQDPEVQLFSATVAEDVSFGPMNLGLSFEEVKRRVDDSLNACGIYELKERATHFLSHGQKKLAAIAGVIAMEPQVIVLDEPIAGLDQRHKEMVLDIFSRLNTNGVTLIMSTHDIDLAYEWADRMIVMKDGRVAGVGTPLEIFSKGDLSISKPIVLEIYERLISRGLLRDNGNVPRFRDELLRELG
ncbi:energy-coupling factor ABC transporter ATP-binding protein [Candidatus Magnetominusculus xianensis]|uniref:ABC transporter ATP-binding protein n=1 Tax=Candidatus Magnetominusculus xianensis TaxID=1748249 RepID=A0ABR5SGZ1_9BACT|nr:ABC transporter ATP-binding protein [Candidatus Magnetominusculus xianensis]KWT81199.1 cobalt ABC transporter ATPase [Candidatus Magnetominusculus xianensis]MBF0404287.1 ABC transporter ATP-binding protein [Nitrospirota bacterium]